MAEAILLRGAKQVLTLRGPTGIRRGAASHDLGIIEDGSVLVNDGIIAAVGTTRRLENLKEARNALEVPVNGKILMPGFVDPSLDLCPDNSQQSRKSSVFYEDSLALMRSCLQHGTLSVDVKTGAAGRDFQADTSILRKLARIGSNPVRMVRTWRVSKEGTETPDTPVDLPDVLNKLSRRKFIHYVEVTQNREGVIEAALLPALQQVPLGVKLAWRGGSAQTLADALDYLHPIAVRCPPRLSLDERSVLANAETVAVLAVGKDVFEGPLDGSARELANAGAAIALSSGYDSSSSASFSMQMAIALAVVRLGLTAEEAFTAATTNAAYAAGCGRLIGSLECGKNADILVLNVPDYREVPRQFGINHVDMVLRDGEVVLNRMRWKGMANR